MADTPVFPAFVKIEHQPNPGAASAFAADVERLLAGARGKLDGFAADARKTLDSALSVPRNATGSLDLGVPQLRAAAEVQRQRAAAAEEVYRATVRAAAAEGTYSQATRQSIAATKALWQEEREAANAALAHANASELLQKELNQQKSATDLVVTATKRGTDATGSVINSQRASRVAFVQTGQQLQDMVVQWQMGTRASTIFAQQVPQMAFALSGLRDSANKTQAAIGSIATFLSGPWGAAIFAATAVLGPFLFNLGKSGDEAKKSEREHRTLTQVLADETASYREVIAALEDYNRAQEQSREITLAGLNVQLAQIRANFDEAVSLREKLAVKLEEARGYNPAAAGVPGFAGGQGNPESAVLAQRFEANRVLIGELVRAGANARIQLGNLASEIATDDTKRIKDHFLTLRQEAEKTPQSVEKLTARLTELRKQEQAALAALKPDRANRGAASLAEFGEDAAKKLANVRDKFTDIPSAVAEANKTVRELDDIISDLERRKPEGFKALVDEAERLKDIAPGFALGQALSDFTADSEHRLEVQRLITAGREDEAQALQTIVQWERTYGELAEGVKQTILDTVTAERLHNEELARKREVLGYYFSATRSIRGEMEAIFSGEGSIKNFGRIFRELNAKVTVDRLFGPALKELDDFVSGRSGVKSATDFLASETERAGQAALTFADVLGVATEMVRNPGPRTGGTGFNEAFGPGWLDRAGAANDNPIVVVGKRDGLAGKSIIDLTPEEYFERAAAALMQPLLGPLTDLTGPKFARGLTTVLAGGLYGYATAGVPGGILGVLKNTVEQVGKDGSEETKATAKAIAKVLGDALAGAQTGTEIAGIAKALGFDKFSTTGAQIGGAIGNAIFGPIGALAGSVLGGTVGALFKSTKWGTSVVGSGVAGGNKSAFSDAALGAGNSVQESLQRLADELGASLGGYSVSIGQVDGEWRVSTSGRSGKLKKKYSDVERFGEDAGAAAAFALMDALRDGALQGLRAGTQRLLQATGDIEANLQKALDFESVFTRLKAYKDPIGAATDALDKEFNRLRKIFAAAGASAAEYADLEELYSIELKQAVEQATRALTGSLRSLLDDLTVGNSSLSLRDRQSLALAAYSPLAGRVAAGDTTAYDDFAEAARTLLDIEREMFGSQSPYFSRLDEVTTLTRTALEANTGTGAFNDNAAVVSAIEQGNSYLHALNQNVGTLIQQNAALIAGQYVDPLGGRVANW